jgi:hypothetical protein
MERKVFTPEEIEKIKELQEKYNTLGVQLVQLKLAQKNAKEYLDSLNSQEQIIEQQVFDTNQEEKDLALQLDEKYGEGSLDLESGEFTPNL